MRCIFCKRDSTGSRSVEHIIPESLGNTTALLPAGIVCDKCNNYFSQNVEKPFLEAEALRALRFHQALPSKKGRIPPLDALLMPEYPVTIYRSVKEGKVAGVIDVGSEGARHLLSAPEARILFPPLKGAPEHSTVSRFLAKVAIEAMAQRVVDEPGGIEYLTDEKQLDLIRRFAREGFPKQWPHVARRIYDANRSLADASGEAFQTVWEYDFLMTRHSEWYFVLAIFGLELTINLGGRETEGYESWLKENAGASPLYSGKNASLSSSG